MGALAAIRPLVVAGLVIVGLFFLTVGTIGLLRFPNVYNRMHATSKPTTLGTATIFLAGFVHFGPGGAGMTSLVGIIFLFLTVPTGAHMISRAAQKTGVSFLEGVTWPADDGLMGEITTNNGGERDASTDEDGEDTATADNDAEGDSSADEESEDTANSGVDSEGDATAGE